MQFRAKARAVDLLGKGQIADLPTAITELWKNGYDAYADNLKAIIYEAGYKNLKNSIFAITDDGKGMSRKEIVDKWLVLGTDSKSRNELEKKESIETLWKKPRIKSGEKGIGRLSVAFLGSPMLMLTKKRGHALQAMLFDWRLLENYNLFLDDIEIPIIEIEHANQFNLQFSKLKKSFLKNFEEEKRSKESVIWEESQQQLKTEIITSINNIELPEFFEVQFLDDIISIDEENGTKFIIFEPIEQITNLIKKDDDNINDNEFIISSLSGFTNEFKNKINKINTEIPIYKSDDGVFDFLTSKGSFFNNKDFEFADVVIDGKFDGDGSFNGTLTLYDENFPYTFTNPRIKKKTNNYGSFDIKIGYSMGILSESKLGEEAYAKLKAKLNLIGGLYLYRDDFRVLPYGRSNYDFLNLEERRSRKAGRYFFSHRRMFGYISLRRKENKNLKDKTSREGLINNSYYRAFRDDLTQLFIEMATDFFATNPKQSTFVDKKKALKTQKEELKKDKERERRERIKLSKELKKFPDIFKKYQNSYTNLVEDLKEQVTGQNVVYSDLEEKLAEIDNLNIEFKNLLPDFPERYKPTESQLDKLVTFEEEIDDFIRTTKTESKALIKKVKSKLQVRELQKEIENKYLRFYSALQKLENNWTIQLTDKFEDIEKEFKNRTSKILDELEFEKKVVQDKINTKEDVIIGIDKISDSFEVLREQFERELTPIVKHITSIDFDINEDILQGAYKAEYEAMKYQWELTRDVAQLGIAVEIVDHEFNQLYSKINHSIDALNENSNFKSSPDFEFLTKNFKQLEDKYDLLSPLYRVSGIAPRKIKCASIFEYLAQFFKEKIEDEDIDFTATTSFEKNIIYIKEPIIHTVFINLINNSIYWLRNASTKTIQLDYLAKTKEILIINSGKKIENHKLEKIFELFYSNKPNGRGLGLYLSKQSLNENYFDIYATNEKKYNKIDGACFVIKPLK